MRGIYEDLHRNIYEDWLKEYDKDDKVKELLDAPATRYKIVPVLIRPQMDEFFEVGLLVSYKDYYTKRLSFKQIKISTVILNGEPGDEYQDIDYSYAVIQQMMDDFDSGIEIDNDDFHRQFWRKAKMLEKTNGFRCHMNAGYDVTYKGKAHGKCV